jgi:hypothetical protein
MKKILVYTLEYRLASGDIMRFNNKIYNKKPSKAWVGNNPDWKLVTYELKELNREK